MTHIEFHCSDEKATALLKAARLYDEGVELEPVRHGRWIQGIVGTECSVCEKPLPGIWKDMSGHDGDNREWFEEIDETPYCPNCGAKMRGAEV